MISKIFNKLKSIFSKNSVSESTKAVNSSKPTKVKKKKTVKSSKSKAPKSKKEEAKQICKAFTSLPGVGAKSAQALYDAGFKTKKQVIAADDKTLLAIPGVGINLVKKLREEAKS